MARVDLDDWMTTGEIARLTGLSVFGVRKAARRIARRIGKPGLVRRLGHDIRVAPEIEREIRDNAERLMVVNEKPERAKWCIADEYDIPRGTLYSMFERGKIASIRHAGIRYYSRKAVEELVKLRKEIAGFKTLSDTAEELGLSRETVRKYIKRFGIRTHKHHPDARKTLVDIEALRIAIERAKGDRK